MMTKEDARELLSYHSCRSQDICNPKWTEGFLGSLRPYIGHLKRSNFDEVMECLYILADEFAKEKVDNELFQDVLSIITLSRVWHINPGFMSSKVMADKDIATLLEWVDTIENCLWWLLQDDKGEAFHYYEEYLKV